MFVFVCVAAGGHRNGDRRLPAALGQFGFGDKAKPLDRHRRLSA